MKTKFLKDGRKVVVCGKINSSEYIVQEIFVTESGDEIPSGENFTAKALLDEPAKSWKAKKEEELNRIIKDREFQADNLRKEINTLSNERKANADHIKRNNFVADALPDFDWDFFCDVLMGNIKYVVEVGWGLKVSIFEESIYNWDSHYGERRYEGIKSLCVWSTGSYQNRPQFHLGRYSDRSGNSSGYEFFRNEEELKRFLSEEVSRRVENSKLTLDDVERISPYFDVDDSVVEKLRKEAKESYLQQYESSVKKAKESLEKSLSKIK